jgi:hypothetical protein
MAKPKVRNWKSKKIELAIITVAEIPLVKAIAKSDILPVLKT